MINVLWDSNALEVVVEMVERVHFVVVLSIVYCPFNAVITAVDKKEKKTRHLSLQSREKNHKKHDLIQHMKKML